MCKFQHIIFERYVFDAITSSLFVTQADSGDSKDLQRKLDDALKDVQDCESKYDDYKSKYGKLKKVSIILRLDQCWYLLSAVKAIEEIQIQCSVQKNHT